MLPWPSWSIDKLHYICTTNRKRAKCLRNRIQMWLCCFSTTLTYLLWKPCDSELSGWWFHLQRFRSFRKVNFILTNFISYQTMFLRPRPQISGYFWIRNSFFPDTASVHTYLVNPQYESATFWIRSPEWKFLNTLWIQNRVDAKSGYFFIRRRNKIEPMAQLFEGRLALNTGFFNFLVFKSNFSDNFLCYF